MRKIAAVALSVFLVPITLYFGLLAALTILQQMLSSFVDFGSASWTAWMSPPVLLGIQSPGGGGGILDALVGGPNAPGGTVGRFIVFFIAAIIAYGGFQGLMAAWSWAWPQKGER